MGQNFDASLLCEPEVIKRYTRFLEPRVSDTDRGKTITGYVTVFDMLSDPIFDFREEIDPGAFTASLANPEITRKSYFNHDGNIILGNSENDTAFFTEDKRGIYLRAYPPETNAAKDVLILVRDNFVNHSSFAFSVKKQKWSGEPGKLRRRILEGEFYEGGPVGDAVYPQTTANSRKLYRSIGVDYDVLKLAVAKMHLEMDMTQQEKDVAARAIDLMSEAIVKNDMVVNGKFAAIRRELQIIEAEYL